MSSFGIHNSSSRSMLAVKARLRVYASSKQRLFPRFCPAHSIIHQHPVSLVHFQVQKEIPAGQFPRWGQHPPSVPSGRVSPMENLNGNTVTLPGHCQFGGVEEA
eukprot:541067-Rhodomonas_salina.1